MPSNPAIGRNGPAISASSTGPGAAPAAAPWWKFGHVWLVIAGPAIVIVAGFVTLWLAISRPDPVVAEDYYRQGIEINKALENPAKSLAPAVKGRNHAATPVQDQPR
ncbi:FixH family protein [Acidovorax sp. LjRoot194]|uniref:FixH family protein n=1 Tax=Acidovorax sp. LjRoot194 TaxID=3342280 RepID=UPI003ECE5695